MPRIAIRLPALLVEGIPQVPMNAEFHSVAACPWDAFEAVAPLSFCYSLFESIYKSKFVEVKYR